MRLFATAVYAKTYAAVKLIFGVNLKGLGYLSRGIREDAEIEVAGVRFFLDHRIASSYGLLIGGRLNEPETRRFLDRTLSPDVTLVDVGANVGEIALLCAKRAGEVIAFEAHPLAAAALRQSVAINDFANVDVVEALVADGGTYDFAPHARNANASAISAAGSTPSLRLDDVLDDVDAPVIFVIDVEGSEPRVLRGAAETIARTRPLIVFEYNHISRTRYQIAEIAELLGPGYEIFRLRRDGSLDDDVESAWNCVAIHGESHFSKQLPEYRSSRNRHP